MEDVAEDGAGVARAGQLVVFVPGAVPGDRVRVRLAAMRRGYAIGELVQVEAPSPDRVVPPCPAARPESLAERCGGCQLQALAYPAQVRAKTRRVQDALARIGGQSGYRLHPCVPAPHPFGYRHKGSWPVRPGPDGAPVAGFFALKSHVLVPTAECLVQAPRNLRALAAALAAVRELGLAPYDEAAHRGVVRHIVVRSSRATGEVMVTLVVTRDEVPEADLVDLIRRRLPELTSLWLNVHPRPGNAVLGPTFRHLFGATGIEEELLGLRFRISPSAFFQVNPEVAELVLEAVLRLGAPRPHERVLDAYCGTGAIALHLAGQAGEVVGVDAVPEAIADAQANARRNGRGRVRFAVDDAAAFLRKAAERGERFDLVVLDPPRKGASEAVAPLLALRPGRVVYVSCDPATLARDVRQLVEGGMRLLEVQPFDMFPQTTHVETVALLQGPERAARAGR